MQPQSSKSTGRKSRSMKTCGRSRRKATTPLTSSAAASPAKTSASPEKVLASPVQGPVFGTSSLGSFAQFGHDGWLSKTCQLSLLEGLEPFSETWPKSGLMRNGTAYRLQPLVRRTDENASGLWRTPSAQESGISPHRLVVADGETLGGECRHYDKHTGRLAQIGLTQQVQLRPLLPTPTASNGPAKTSHQRTWSTTYAGLHNFATGKGKQLPNWTRWPTPSASGMPCEGTVRLCRQAWLDGNATLEEANAIAGRDVRDAQGKVAAMFPTPTVQDASNNGGPSQYDRNSLPLNAVAGGALNPTWVEWLMGFPLGWTALDASETPSSRKSSKSSGGR